MSGDRDGRPFARRAHRARPRDGVAAAAAPRDRGARRHGPLPRDRGGGGWARTNDDGHLSSRVEIDELREVGDRYVAADARRQWGWKEEDDLAAEARFGVLFELRDGHVLSLAPGLPTIIDAIDSIPVRPVGDRIGSLPVRRRRQGVILGFASVVATFAAFRGTGRGSGRNRSAPDSQRLPDQRRVGGKLRDRPRSGRRDRQRGEPGRSSRLYEQLRHEHDPDLDRIPPPER